MKPFSLKLAEADIRHLEEEAQRCGNTPSGLARHYIRQGLQGADWKEAIRPKKEGK